CAHSRRARAGNFRQSFSAAKIRGESRMTRPLTGTPPQLVAPPGSCDTHIHFYSARYPKHPDGPPPPADATVADYRQLQKWLGLQRVIVLQPTPSGDANRCTMEAGGALGRARASGVVVVHATGSDAELDRLTRAGARAVRIMCLPGGHLKWDVMDEVIARVRPFGWHPIVQFDGREFVE